MRKKLFTLLLAFALVISMNTWANNTKAEDKIRITFEAQTVKAGTESNVKIESTDDVTISSVYWAQKTYGFNDFATGNEIHQSIDVDPDTDTGIFYPVHEGEGWIEIHYKEQDNRTYVIKSEKINVTDGVHVYVERPVPGEYVPRGKTYTVKYTISGVWDSFSVKPYVWVSLDDSTNFIDYDDGFEITSDYSFEYTVNPTEQTDHFSYGLSITDKYDNSIFSDNDGYNGMAIPVTVPDLWEEATYTWNEDNSEVHASRYYNKVERGEGAFTFACEIEEVAKTTSETIPPTTTSEGKTIYKAIFEREVFENQTKEVIIPKLDPTPTPTPTPNPAPTPSPTKTPKPVPADLVEAFVTRCYRVILNREPDPSGLADWTKALADGTKKAAEIINGFMNSQEYKNKNHTDAESVEILYMAMLNRASDEGGKRHWMSALHVGNPFAVVINGFCGSQEFAALCKEYGIQPGSVKTAATIPFDPNWVAPDTTKVEAFVTRCYNVILGRDPDPSGLKDWTNALVNGTKNAAEIISGFVNSDEFKNKNLTNEQAVEVLYQAMLGRGSDPSGLADWTKKLDEGKPFSAIINGFCGSTEFKNICNEYGITPGSVKTNDSNLKKVSANDEAPVALKTAAEPAVTEPEVTETSDETEPQALAVAEDEVTETPEEPTPQASAVDVVKTNEDQIRAFIQHCYTTALKRNASENEIADYVERIKNGKVTPKKVAENIIFSDEFQGKNYGNEELVRILYRLYCRRDVDDNILTEFVRLLDSGMPMKALIDRLAKSPEFKSVVNSLK